MNITCENCEQVVSKYLCDIPKQWRCQMVNAICQTIPNIFDCQFVKDCETVTRLKAFSASGSVITLTFVNEHNDEQTLVFNFTDLIDTSLDNVDPLCLMSQSQWDAASHLQRIQALVNNVCDICNNPHPVNPPGND